SRRFRAASLSVCRSGDNMLIVWFDWGVARLFIRARRWANFPARYRDKEDELSGQHRCEVTLPTKPW
ncbi:MAG: hypothetical protein OXP36_00345, partial [Gammaproteobacteria bacterium]|nr:hypothetical protein [Gammaproteobacteria bacterium]